MRSPNGTLVEVWRLTGDEEVHVPKLSGKFRTLDPAGMVIKVTGRRGMECQLPQAEYGVHFDISPCCWFVAD
jgi:hypothetical protein